MSKIRSERTKANKARAAARRDRKAKTIGAKRRKLERAAKNQAKGIPRPSTLAKWGKTPKVEPVEAAAG